MGWRAWHEEHPGPGSPIGRQRVDYERHGRTYARLRREDPRIAARIHAALEDAGTVLNVGAGAGSYEPRDPWLLAVEPSETMRAQRHHDAPPAIAASAEELPFDDNSVDAAMACVTIHHWESPPQGLAELRRVSRGPVVIFTFELDALPAWQHEFLREGLERERPRFPALGDIASALGGRTRIKRIPTPGDCTDGFFEAFWRRPRRFWTRRSAAPSRCGRCSIRAWSSGWSIASPEHSPPAHGTPSTVTCASRTASTALCGSSSRKHRKPATKANMTRLRSLGKAWPAPTEGAGHPRL